MLGKAIVDGYGLSVPTVDFPEIERLTTQCRGTPRIRFSHDSKRPHLTKPEELSIRGTRYRGKRVIFLVRDPRDVMVSLYFHRTKRVKDYVGEISSLIRNESYGVYNYLRFLRTWYENKDKPLKLLLVRYEDMRHNAYRELDRIIDFIDLPKITHEVIQEAVAFADFNHMQKMERAGVFRSGSGGIVPTNGEDIESFKSRRGRVGGYFEYLSEEDIQYIERAMREDLPAYFGYTTSCV